jgi:hypothetical protein
VQSTFSSRIVEASTTRVSATVGMTSFELWWSEVTRQVVASLERVFTAGSIPERTGYGA